MCTTDMCSRGWMSQQQTKSSLKTPAPAGINNKFRLGYIELFKNRCKVSFQCIDYFELKLNSSPPPPFSCSTLFSNCLLVFLA
jgi:hypothetical protein